MVHKQLGKSFGYRLLCDQYDNKLVPFYLTPTSGQHFAAQIDRLTEQKLLIAGHFKHKHWKYVDCPVCLEKGGKTQSEAAWRELHENAIYEGAYDAASIDYHQSAEGDGSEN